MNKVTISKLLKLLSVFFLTLLIFLHFYNKNKIVEFTGVLNNYRTGCSFDGPCYAYVGKSVILTNPGAVIHKPKEIGKENIGKNDIGSKVKVRAIKTGLFRYTLIGDKTLYLLKID